MEQRASGQLLLWANPFTGLRLPKIFNLRTDPYERADVTSNTYYDWIFDHVFLLVPAQDYVGQFLAIVPGIPAAAEGSQLQSGRSHGEDEGGELTRRLTHRGPTLARYRRTAEERFFDKQECRRKKTLSFVVSPQNAKMGGMTMQTKLATALAAFVLISGFVAAGTNEASAVVYCQYVSYPAGCVVRPGVVLRPRPVARAAAREAVRPGTPMN